MAGFTSPDARPWINKMRKAGGKVAREIARSVWKVDFVKILRLSIGPAILAA